MVAFHVFQIVQMVINCTKRFKCIVTNFLAQQNFLYAVFSNDLSIVNWRNSKICQILNKKLLQ